MSIFKFLVKQIFSVIIKSYKATSKEKGRRDLEDISNIPSTFNLFVLLHKLINKAEKTFSLSNFMLQYELK